MAGLISYARGKIVVLDRPGLLNLSCDCYALQKASTPLEIGAFAYREPDRPVVVYDRDAPAQAAPRATR
jgi:hypothetical protein